MPSFTVQVPNLQVMGAIVEVEIAPSKAFINQFKTSPVPTVKVLAQIDTGASGTVIKAGMLAPLGIHPIGKVPINTPSSTNVLCDVYDVQFLLPRNIVIGTQIIEAPLTGQPIQMLIGRNVLRFSVFIYNGYMNQFTFSV